MNDTPMMRQYWEAKRSCPDAILLFRMGDFYELFHDDAKTASRALGLTLTSREKGEDPIPMAGFPYHQLEGYLAKLLQLGYRAAICDQVEDPKQAKGLVRRELTRVVSAGTVVDEELLEPGRSNYLMAVAESLSDPGLLGLAWVELSTGSFQAGTCATERWEDELARIEPVECLLPEGFSHELSQQNGRPAKTLRPNWMFGATQAFTALCEQFGVRNLEGFGFNDPASPEVRAAGAILQYLKEMQRAGLPQIDRLTPYSPTSTLQIDEATRRSLEIHKTLRDGKREGSLLAAIDRTVTSPGARLLADWVAQPLTSKPLIDARLNAVAELIADARLWQSLQDGLRKLFDMERLVTRVVTQRATPRDLSCLAKTLAGLPAIRAKLAGRSAELLNQMERDFDLCPETRQALESALREDCPLSAKEGAIIQDGFHPRLDELRDLAAGGKKWIAEYQAQESQASGIPSLKVGFNKVFGYYLEVTHVHTDKVPKHYIRKQTLTNAERYVTPELKDYEEKVLRADEESKQLEYDLFVELRDKAAKDASRLSAVARILARLDVLTSFARLAAERNYCRPTIVEEAVLEISEGRHPVLDGLLPPGKFVPNDIQCACHEDRLLLITGPNMAGKSTYIRQAALLTLLAHVGSFLPAKSASVGLTDRIFARVGASDELSRGQSTFMVEMTESARILNLASARSLVILDEIGRGTSTYDGLSLAWSIVEHLHNQVGCRTLFATHYHELTELANQLPGVRNYNVAVKEWAGKIAFLHRITPGAADKSYGIHVARLAGIPESVNVRAEAILAELESQSHAGEGAVGFRTGLFPDRDVPGLPRPKKSRSGNRQLLLFEPLTHPVVERLRGLDMNTLTPLEALQILAELKKECTAK